MPVMNKNYQKKTHSHCHSYIVVCSNQIKELGSKGHPADFLQGLSIFDHEAPRNKQSAARVHWHVRFMLESVQGLQETSGQTKALGQHCIFALAP